MQNFYPADEYHQDYLDKHPDGYCHLPKVVLAGKSAPKIIREDKLNALL